MHELLNLADRELVEKLDELEKHGPVDGAVFDRFKTMRSDLSRVAWNAFAEGLGCDAGPMSRTGVMVFPLDEGLANRILAAQLASPRTAMQQHDSAAGYIGTGQEQCDYLSTCNEYRELTPEVRALLAEFLSSVGATVERSIGHPFRIGSTRQFQLVPNRPLADRHRDGWPVAIRKLFVLPRGCGRRSGTTWFRLRDGQELELDSQTPIWVLFENSVVEHAPISSKALRPTVEFDLLPAKATNLEPFHAGLAGWYPWFPTEAGMAEGTRLALTRSLAGGPAPAAQAAPVARPAEKPRSMLERLLGR